jgi:hypothetical protein
MKKFFQQLTWQAVALILGGGVIFLLIVLLAPPNTQALFFGANGLVFTLLGLANDWRRKPEKLSDPDRTPTDPGV